MKIKLTSLLLSLFSVLLLAACKETAKPTSESDVIGLRWGMSAAKVWDVYPKTGTFIPKSGYGSTHEPVILAGREWALSTVSGYAGTGLQAIQLEYETKDNKEAQAIYAQMCDLLVQRYGTQPLVNNQFTMTWEIPRTIITLIYLPYWGVEVSYSARPGYEDLDKL